MASKKTYLGPKLRQLRKDAGQTQLAEGAGAAPLAALLQERSAMQGRRVGLILSGGNIDRAVYQEILSEA